MTKHGGQPGCAGGVQGGVLILLFIISFVPKGTRASTSCEITELNLMFRLQTSLHLKKKDIWEGGDAASMVSPPPRTAKSGSSAWKK